MCGICGIIDMEGRKAEKHTIQKMMSLMKHRGPDDEGLFLDDNVGLGHVRLSILDLSSAGHQPMYSNDGRYVLIFNGEIYNYIELKEELSSFYDFKTRTDTEVILAAYSRWGQNCLDKLNGDWAFVLYDTIKETVFAARDRYGIKPFYYSTSDGRLIFASELKVLLGVINKKSPEYQNIFDYLIYNRTDHNESTFFVNIFKLKHGHCLIYKNRNFEIKKWYELKDEVVKNNHKDFNTEGFRDLLEDSIKIRLRSDVPLGVSLSGGLDSSSIVSIITSLNNRSNLNTFSAVYEDYKYADESGFISLFSKVIENMHYTYPTANTFLNDYRDFIHAQGEPVASIGPYAQFKVMDLAKEFVKVTIDGQGADEQLAGYHYFFGTYFKELLREYRLFKLLGEMYYYLAVHKSFLALKYMLFYLLPNKLQKIAGSKVYGSVSKTFFNNYQTDSTINEYLYSTRTLKESLLNHFEYKLEHLLKWEDHNSMFFSMESRVPFLDHRLVEKTLTLDKEQIINKGNTKYILRNAMRSKMPDEIVHRQDKKGFSTPADDWFREKAFADTISQILHSKRFKERGILDVNSCINRFEKHKEKKINISKDIWKWVNLEIWFRDYIDN